MAKAPPNTKDELAAVQAAHAADTERLQVVDSERAERLLAGDDAAVDRLDIEIAALRKLVDRQAERIVLLKKRAVDEADATKLRAQGDVIERVAKKLEQSVEAARRLQQAVEAVDREWRQVIALRQECMPVFALGDPNVNATVVSPDGAALTAGALTAMLRHEFFRVGARVSLGGTSGMQSDPSLPGGVAPHLGLSMQPEKVRPIAERLEAATGHAIGLLREKLNPARAAPAAPIQLVTTVPAPLAGAAEPAPAGDRLSELLAKQTVLAKDPAQEAAYMAVVAEIASMTEAA